MIYLILTSFEFHLPDVDHFPVSYTKRVRVFNVVRELHAFSVFVVRFKYIKEETAAADCFCMHKNYTVERPRIRRKAINELNNNSCLFTFTERLTRFDFAVPATFGCKQRTKIQRRQLVAPDVYHGLQRYQLFGILVRRIGKTVYS